MLACLSLCSSQHPPPPPRYRVSQRLLRPWGSPRAAQAGFLQQIWLSYRRRGISALLRGCFFFFFTRRRGKISTVDAALVSFSPDCLLRLPLSCCRRRRHRLRTPFGLPRTDSRATHQPLGAVKSSGGEESFYFSGFSLQSGALEGPMYAFSVTQHRYRVVMIDNIYFQFDTKIDILGGRYCDININTPFGL